MGGPAGDRASVAAVEALKPLERATPAAGDLLNALALAVDRADLAVRGIAESAEGQPGTTLTAMLWSGSRLALVHIGDTRAYLLRAGELFQITHDHTYVQTLVDEGRLTPAEAASHPQRSLLVRALDGTGRMRPDLSLHEVAAGDRYLLCSDGLSTVVPADDLAAAVRRPDEPRQVVDRLVRLAHDNGAPDNIACVVADVVEV